MLNDLTTRPAGEITFWLPCKHRGPVYIYTISGNVQLIHVIIDTNFNFIEWFLSFIAVQWPVFRKHFVALIRATVYTKHILLKLLSGVSALRVGCEFVLCSPTRDSTAQHVRLM